MDSNQRQATVHRAALLLGLVSGDDVVRWAETLIAANTVPLPQWLELALTSPQDLTELRAALQPIAASAESSAVCRTILALTAGDLASGRRSIRDTVTVLTQISARLSIAPAWADAIDTLTDNVMLATAGVAGRPEAAEAAVAGWLAQFDEACHGFRCEGPAEAAGFVAALSRVIQSPAVAVLAEGAEAKVWTSPPGPDNGVVLYLNRVALELARSAFAPVPIIESTTESALPATVRLVITGASCRAMGRDHAERALLEVWNSP